MANEKKSANPFWPSVADLPSATKASDAAFWAAVFVALLTAAIATFALVTKTAIASVDASAYVDAAIFGVVAWRIRRRSRAWAITGLVLFLVEKFFQISQDPSASSGIVMALLFVLLFIGGIRGNFAIYKFNHVPNPSESTPAPESSGTSETQQ